MYISLALLCAVILVSAYSVLAALGILPELPIVVPLATNLFSLLSVALFMVFLRLVGAYIHRDDLAQTARSVLNLGIFLILGFIALIPIVFLLALIMPPPAALLIVGGGAVGKQVALWDGRNEVDATGRLRSGHLLESGLIVAVAHENDSSIVCQQRGCAHQVL